MAGAASPPRETEADEQVVRIPSAELATFTRAAFARCGLGDDDASAVADTLAQADLRGTYSHGVIRLPFLVGRVRKGGANPLPNIRVVTEDLATAVVDGDRALGQVTAIRCMRIAMEKARHTGLGCAVARNSDFIGACAYYPMMALAADMIGVGWTNSFPGMAPWGGRTNKICNNPLAVAVPTLRRPPIVLDMAMSVVAGGRVRLAAKKGEKVPIGWIVNKEGKRTDDPNDLPGGGALLPLGYKGYGLAVIGEVLSGVLSGAKILDEIPMWFSNPESPVGNGHFHMAIDVSRFCEPAAFKARMDQLVEMLKGTPLMEGFEEILVPGEPEARRAAEQSVHGIRVPVPVLQDLLALGAELELSTPKSFSMDRARDARTTR